MKTSPGVNSSRRENPRTYRLVERPHVSVRIGKRVRRGFNNSGPLGSYPPRKK